MPKFMVVDDNPGTVSALRTLLQEDGHEVDAFTDSREALEALAHGSFDAILTDLDMPHIGGDVVVKAARQHHPAACVFVSTARLGGVSLEGACHVFEKPIDYDEITRTISDCQSRGGPGGKWSCYLMATAALAKK